MRILGRIFFYSMMAIFALMTVTLPGVIFERGDHWEHFNKNAVTTQGVVVDAAYHANCPSQKGLHLCIPVVEFSTPQGEKFKVPDYKVRTYHQGMSKGSRVQIAYLPNDPQTAYIDIGIKGHKKRAQTERIVFSVLWVISLLITLLFLKEFVIDRLRGKNRPETDEREESEETDS